MMAGCIQSDGETWGGVGDYQVSADWYVIEVETKTEYYPDGENVSWSVESSLVSESINSRWRKRCWNVIFLELSK